MDEIVVKVEEPEADDARLEQLALGLREELLTTDVDEVKQLREGEAPEGARALDIATIGALLVSAAGGVEAVSRIVTTIRGWLNRGGEGGTARTVTVTIGDRTMILEQASAEQQDKLIAAFLEDIPAR